MKRFLLKSVERSYLIVMVLLSLCTFVNAKAQTAATSDEINAAIVESSDVPLTWTNDAEHPWYISTDNDYTIIRTPETQEDGVFTTVLKLSYTSDKATQFSFDWAVRYYNQNERNVKLIIDGKEWGSCSIDFWENNKHILLAGSHEIEFISTSKECKYSNNYYCSRIKSVSVKGLDWTEVAVSSPGQFVSNLVDVIGDKSVLDVEYLKITGSMNDSDWESLRRLSGLIAIDLTDSDITVIPSEAFQGLSNLNIVELPNSVVEIGRSAFYDLSYLKDISLPESLEKIGASAFKRSGLIEIIIPAKVERIEEETFWSCYNLKNITFAEDSRLRSIGINAFSYSKIEEFIMPDVVDTINFGGVVYSPFHYCGELRHVKISKSLTKIPNYLFCNESQLTSVEIPEGVQTIGNEAFLGCKIESILLPESLTSIGEEAFNSNSLQSIVIPSNVTSIGRKAFSACKNLKNVTLNANITNLSSTFSGCDSIQTIILPCATPPSVVDDPFLGSDKNVVIVNVPEFALATYKIDPYWFLFRNLKSSTEISNSDHWAINGNLRLNSSHTIPGTPSIDIAAGGTLNVAADTPLTLNEVTYSVNEDLPAIFLNESDQVSANSLTTKFTVPSANKWYFFSPVTDVNMAEVTYPATESWVIRYYDGALRASNNSASGNWVNVPADGTLKRGQGYIIQAATAGTLYMPAATSQHPAFFGTGEASMTLVDNSCETAENAGWNLVGNPYPTYYDIYSMALEAPITIWNGTTYRAYSLSDDDLLLRPMQPFFVQKADAALTLGMPRSGRQATTEIYHSSAPRAKTVDPNRHRLNLEIIRGENESADDYTRIVLNESASLAYEGKHDASKFMSMNSDIAQIYSLGDNRHPMAINERPYADGNVALGMFIPKEGETYRIAASRADRKAWLYDAETGAEQDLTEGDYIFTADKAGNCDSRFSIRFAPAEATAVDGVEAAGVKVAGGKGLLTVTAPADAEVAVYAADGSVVANAEGSIEVNAPAGVYVVKVNGQGYKTIVK